MGFFDNLQLTLAPPDKQQQRRQNTSAPLKQKQPETAITNEKSATPPNTPPSTIVHPRTNSTPMSRNQPLMPSLRPTTSSTREHPANTMETNDHPSPIPRTSSSTVIKVQPHVVKISRSKRVIQSARRVT